jgi:zinc transport system substrate-binding protein
MTPDGAPSRPLSQIVISVMIAAGLLTIMAFVGNPQYPTDNRIRVVVSILPQAEFVKAVGGNHVNVTVMVPPGQEPHTYSPKPSQMRDLERADIYFKLGSGIEFELVWMDKFTELNRNMLVVDGSESLHLMDKDPHIWLSLRNVEAMVLDLEHGFEEIDPLNASYYNDNARTYLQKLDKLDTNITEAFASLTKRDLLVFHPAWGYFARDYGLNQTAIEYDGKEPTTQYFAGVIDFAKEHGIKVIFAEPQFSTRIAEEIAQEVGGVVVLVDDLAEDYLDNMQLVADKIAEGLSAHA